MPCRLCEPDPMQNGGPRNLSSVFYRISVCRLFRAGGGDSDCVDDNDDDDDDYAGPTRVGSPSSPTAKPERCGDRRDSFLSFLDGAHAQKRGWLISPLTRSVPHQIGLHKGPSRYDVHTGDGKQQSNLFQTQLVLKTSWFKPNGIKTVQMVKGENSHR